MMTQIINNGCDCPVWVPAEPDPREAIYLLGLWQVMMFLVICFLIHIWVDGRRRWPEGFWNRTTWTQDDVVLFIGIVVMVLSLSLQIANQVFGWLPYSPEIQLYALCGIALVTMLAILCLSQ